MSMPAFDLGIELSRQLYAKCIYLANPCNKRKLETEFLESVHILSSHMCKNE